MYIPRCVGKVIICGIKACSRYNVLSAFVIVPDDEHEGCFLPYLYVQLKDGYTLDDVRDKINACLPERYMRPVEIFTVPERPFFHFKTNRIGLSKEIIAKRNQQKEKAKRNSFADGCIA